MKDENIIDLTDVFERPGSFRIDTNLLEKAPAKFSHLMRPFLIVRAEMIYMGDYIQYQAYSHLFEKNPMGVIIPEYEIIMDGLTVQVKRL